MATDCVRSGRARMRPLRLPRGGILFSCAQKIRVERTKLLLLILLLGFFEQAH